MTPETNQTARPRPTLVEPMDFSDYEPIGGADNESAAALAPPPADVSLLNPLVGSRSYRLLSPLKIDGKVVRIVTMRYPTQGEIDALADEAMTVRELIAACCGLPVEAILTMIAPDSAAVHGIFIDLAPFLKGE